ncbi:unnamed protein product [Ectocarpus fasciculatus]
MCKCELGRSMALWAVAVAVLFGFTATPTVAQERVYSKWWMTDMLNSGESGFCSPLSHTYRWRNVGWGSNLNRFLALWLNSIVRDSDSNDFGLDVSPVFFTNTKCPVASERTGGEVSGGWKCFFQPIPRLCVFESDEVRRAVQQGDFASASVRRPCCPSSTLKSTTNREAYLVPCHACLPLTAILEPALHVLIMQDLGKFLVTNYKEAQRPNLPKQSPRARLQDETETAAVLVGYLYSHMQPWFKEDTESVLQESDVVSVRSGRYVAIHVRRGDKVILNEASRIEVEVSNT